MHRFIALTLLTGALAAQTPAASPTAAPKPPDCFKNKPPSDVTKLPDGRCISWKEMVPNLLHDQANIYTFPVRLMQGHDLLPTVGVLAGTAAFVATDPLDGPYFRKTTDFKYYNHVFVGNATSIGTGLVPAVFYLVGLSRKDKWAQSTALLAGEAIADVEILDSVMKNATRRLRPASFPPGAPMGHTWFASTGGHILSGQGSFPSGHAIAAFAVATVYSRRYPKLRWVPYVAYGLASAVGFSRVTLSAHFPSDVFMGAALGYSISRFTVLGGR